MKALLDTHNDLAIAPRQTNLASVDPRIRTARRAIQVLTDTLSATDWLVAGFSLLLALLAVAAHTRVPGWQTVALTELLAAATLLLLAVLAARWRGSEVNSPLTKAVSVLHDWSPLLFYILWFEHSENFAHLWRSGWHDQWLVRLDHLLLGVDPTIWCERFASRAVTELMSFGYFSYYAYLPLLLWWFTFKRRSDAFRLTLLAAAVTYAMCNLLFPVFATEGPYYTFSSLQHVALTGGFFTACVALVEGVARIHGSAFPSAHVAGAVVALLCGRRFAPKIALFATPVVMLMCAATVYLRFHYFTDILGGTVVGVAGFGITTLWMRYERCTRPCAQNSNTADRSTARRSLRPFAFVGLLTVGVFITPQASAVQRSTAVQQHVDNFEQEIQAAMSDMYDARLDSATLHAQRLAVLRPEHPAGAVYLELIDWWPAVVDPGNDTLAVQFDKQAETAINQCRTWVGRHPNDADGWLYLASAYGAKARFATTVRRRAWVALRAGLDAHSAVLRAQQIDPALADEGLGLGAYDYFAATLPPFIRPFVWLFGVSGDRERGLHELEQTAVRGKHARTEALLVLASAWWSESQFQLFEDTLARIEQPFPHNLLVKAWQVSGWIRLREWARANGVIDDAQRRSLAPAPWLAFQSGRVALASGEYKRAEMEFTRAIDGGSSNRSLFAWACEGRARAREALQRADEADHSLARQAAPAAMAFSDELLRGWKQ